MEALPTLMEELSEDANLVAFRYLEQAHRGEYPKLMPKTINLSGANLRGCKVSGRSEDEPLVLKNVCFEGANLSESEWRWIRLEGGSFQNAFVTQSRWQNCSLARLKIANSHGEGIRFEDCDFKEIVPAISEEWRGAWVTQSGNPNQTHPLMPEGAVIEQLERLQNDHEGSILSVCYDKKQSRYVTGSDAGKLRVWDAESLEWVATAILLPSDEWAVVGPDKITTLALSDDADRHLKWLARSDSGERKAYPFHR